MSTTTLPPTIDPPAWEGVPLRKRMVWRAEGVLARHRDAFLLIGLVAIAVTLRLLMTRGLWLDEATSVAQARMDFGRMLSYMRQSDVHPPLYQALLWGNVRLFGLSEFAVRLPSLILGAALVPAIYGFGRELFNRKTGLIAALFIAIGPAAVWYSQEARMYPLFMLLAVLTLWAQVRVVRSGSKKAWIAYTLTTGALLWTHYFSALHILVQQLAFLVLIWQGRRTIEGRKLFWGWLRSAFAIVLVVAPMSIIPMAQIGNYGDRDTVTLQSAGASAGEPIYTAISNISSALLGYHSDSTMTMINALWPLGMLALLLALGRGRTRSTLLLGAVIAVPMTVLFIIGIERRDVFELRYFAGAVPVLSLLLARAITCITKRNVTTAVAVVALSVVLLGALADEQVDGGNARSYDFRAALTELEADHQPGDLMLFEPFYLHPTVNYYSPSYTNYPLVTGLSSTTAPKRIVVVSSLAFAESEQSRQRVDQIVERLTRDRNLEEHKQLNNIETWTFS